ncbi:MAG TPA: nucleotide-binding protein [Pyrinomonadaceae bacterium]|jgi:hypothetical protein|nr:nucleotide-binding protein [Pyrinomonadaceae bacterium]
MQSVPKVFVASSGEAVRLAQAIEQNLKIAEVRLWSTPDVLYPGSNLIDELNRILKHSDFGVFIFSGDDEVKIKGQRQQAVRDNVILELGMFMGHLGKERSFIVQPRGINLRLPTDLLGILTLNYDKDRAKEEPASALRSACTQIEDAIKRQHKRRSKELSKAISESLETICWSMSAPLTPERATLRAFIFKKENNELVCIGFWDPYESVEQVGLSFPIDERTASQVAVVRCLLDNATRRTSEAGGCNVKPLPANFGAKGKGVVSDKVRYVLAAPIRNENDTIWGVVDFDASNSIGIRLLQKQPTANAVIQRLARDLSKILAN